MMVKKKKAQTTIEILIIFGVLILGVILFGLFYFTNLHTKIDTSSTVQGTYSDIEKNLQGGDPTAIQEYCGNGNCVSPETCESCSQDCGACPGQINLDLSLDPDEITPQGRHPNKQFGIKAEVNDYTGGQVYIKKIQVYNEQGTAVDYCYYDSHQIPAGGYEFPTPLEMTKSGDDYSYTLDKFICRNLGRKHTIQVTAGLSEDGYDVIDAIEKDIGQLTAELSLNPEGYTSENVPFGINVAVDEYNSKGDINITKIYVKLIDVTNPNTADCFYNDFSLKNGKSVNIQMIKTDNDYTYSFGNTFRCNQPGKYLFEIVVHDNDETNLVYDWMAEIPKKIKTTGCVFMGEGTPSDPYKIFNETQLDCVRYNLSSNYKLMSDLNLSKAYLQSQPWFDSTYGWLPIGTNSAAFTGSFNGNGHKIQNLYINRRSPDANVRTGGLFFKATDAEFTDINLTDVNVSVAPGGSLVFLLENSNVNDCHATGNVRGSNGSGGLIGYVYDSNITNSSFTGNFTGTASFTGGLIGEVRYINTYSEIFNCHFSGNYNSIASVSGGLIGAAGGAIIDKCYTTGNVNARSGCVGGLVGCLGQIFNSYSTANVTGTSGGTGGLSGGRNYITNSYSTGQVSGTILVGGLRGGGHGQSGILNSYWDMNTSGQTTSYGGIGKTTTEMKQQATFVDWNFTDIWAINEGTSYPYLIITTNSQEEPKEIIEDLKKEKLDITVSLNTAPPIK